MSEINNLLHSVLRRHLVPREMYACGFANLAGLLPAKYAGYSSGIAIAARLDDRIVDGIIAAPTQAYYEHYTAVNERLILVCRGIAGDLAKEGIRALPVRPTYPSAPSDTGTRIPYLTGEISHKMVATRAGLGWIGKTDLFISLEFGARLRLSSILVDLPVTPESEPVDVSKCGKCMICVQRCPARAATGQPWNIYTASSSFFDALRCRDKCSEFGKEIFGSDTRICGICVAACPVGRPAKKRAPVT